VISPKDIAAQENNGNFDSWKDLATKSLKGKPLEKYLEISSLEGIDKSIFYAESAGEIELKTYPLKQIRTQFYDLKKYSKEHFEQDCELGLEKFIMQVQGDKLEHAYLAQDKTHFHVQLAKNSCIENYQGQNISIDVNDLIFKDFEAEVTRVQKVNPSAKFLIDLSHIHNAGGSVVQEITYALSLYANLLECDVASEKIEFRVSCHSELFLNIAKLKALRYLCERMLEQAGQELIIEIHATNSLREQTLYDPWNNILRNSTSTMAQIMGGANSISTRSYDYLFSKLTIEKPSLLAHRYATQTLNILFEESHIEAIHNPTKGSFYIDSICHALIKASWESFLNWRERSFLNSAKDFAIEVEAIAKLRRNEVRTRKKVITGVNDFADPEQTIEKLYSKKWRPVELNFGYFPLRRLAYEFESLRISNELSDKKEKVAIYCRGELAQINARLNFIQNIFDTTVIPYKVIDNQDLGNLDEFSALVLCAPDDMYQDFLSDLKEQKVAARRLFIAGGFKSDDLKHENLQMGMDIYSFVQSFIKEEEV
tara:strand:+ start:9988 stop:11607 length:1620 start_codon:yes stop_codon:yes gene_type:complete